MISLPRQAILEYQEVYKQQFGMQISYEEAEKQASELLELVNYIYRPIRKEWINNNKGVKRHNKHRQ